MFYNIGMRNAIKNLIGIAIYKLMENIDGENGLRLIDITKAQPIKMYCLNNLIN